MTDEVKEGLKTLEEISLLEYNDVCLKMQAEIELMDKDPLRSSLNLYKLQSLADKLWLRHIKDREQTINHLYL